MILVVAVEECRQRAGVTQHLNSGHSLSGVGCSGLSSLANNRAGLPAPVPGSPSTLSISGRFQRAMSPLEQQLDRAIGQCTSEAPAIATDRWRSSQPIHNRTEWSLFRQAASAGVLTGIHLPVVHHDVRFGA